MRLILAYKAHPEGAEDLYTSLLPIGLGYLHAVVASRGHESRVDNFSRIGWKAISSQLAKFRPHIVGISIFTHNRFESLQLASTVKRTLPGCMVVVGGPHATHRYAELLRACKDIDVVVLGEGEETFADLVDAVAVGDLSRFSKIPGLAMRNGEGVQVTGSRRPIGDLDSLPLPAAWLSRGTGIELHRQLEFITTSRGCPASCRFCSSPSFWGKNVRFRSARNIVDEIRFIRDRFGLIYFSFRDDTFTADRRRVMELCRLLVQEKVHIMWNCQSRVSSLDDEMLLWMKRAGCECVQIGVESGSVSLLRFLGKGISPERVEAAARSVRRVGMHLSVYLISGIPGEDESDRAATARLMEAIRPHDGHVSPLAYYPGTALFSDRVASGEVGADLFESHRSAGLLVHTGPQAKKSADVLFNALQRASRRSVYRAKDFALHKSVVGYCHGTNILAGAWFEGQGEWERAEAEYAEIISREPENPWGWMALGELQGEEGRLTEADASFSEVCRLLPSHAPAHAARGEVARLSGKRQEAEAHYARALGLDLSEVTAREGLRMLDKGRG